jgi:hypothetical protein
VYIRRFTGELADHCEDFLQEPQRMDAKLLNSRLGAPDELACRAAAALRQRTYAGRHPLITFVAAPLPTAALLLASLVAAFLLVLSAVPEGSTANDYGPVWAAIVMQGTVWTMRFVPFVVGALLFCHLARGAVRGRRWSLVACGLVALLAVAFSVSLTMPTYGPGSGRLTLGFGVPPSGTQWLQALAPLAIWLAYSAREIMGREPIDAG